MVLGRGAERRIRSRIRDSVFSFQLFLQLQILRVCKSQGQAKICPMIRGKVIISIEKKVQVKMLSCHLACWSDERMLAQFLSLISAERPPVFRAVIKWGEITRLTLGELFCARDIWTDKVRSSHDKETFYWGNPQSFIGYGEMKEPTPFPFQNEGRSIT